MRSGCKANGDAGFEAFMGVHHLNFEVADAVKGGKFESGLDHYEDFGKKEGRRSRCGGIPRENKALFLIKKKGLGLEIGPSHNPIAPKKNGLNVHILDHLDAGALRLKYKAHGVKIENIEDVHFVWKSELLPDLFGQKSHYDWIIASHVIERMPDLVSFLQQCTALLKADGKLSLIIPDKRYCFDYLSPTSTTGELLDACEEKRTRPNVGKVFDHVSSACKRGAIAWSAEISGDLESVHTIEHARTLWQQARNGSNYIDVHCWRFTPESSHIILSDLNILKLTELGILREFETTGCEFYVTLGKVDRFPKLNRLQMPQESKASDV